MRSRREANRRGVFLNVPFDRGYERLFVALISALVSIGRVPHCVLEIPEQGTGRLARIFRLIQDCPVSLHDLSRVGRPVRFNMPFELGLAVALSRMERRPKFIILESEQYRLQRTLSDLNGFDPGIHKSSVRGIITCSLAHIGKPHGNPDTQSVLRVHRKLWRAVPEFKRINGRADIYSRPIFALLIDAATILAKKEGLIAA
jgi:hypothetical protein